jgi:hypothetical protein
MVDTTPVLKELCLIINEFDKLVDKNEKDK